MQELDKYRNKFGSCEVPKHEPMKAIARGEYIE